ncbi:MBL fold metallo-hydrolase [Pseudoalteromonas distincta]|uniref:MBL fold metallo-hydrolase n=1 Tax=Pseudoalteromonas distincta TaxID=77608 RepID=UPI0011F38A44|nr:MBL fold metallo-hydrolase [Pseudoalteromonas distincta]KAA1153176.1 MBL fold metallo-hydrolase [Pseudoalteromonas distincta]
MHFKALPVKKGDAFYLHRIIGEENNGKYKKENSVQILFDAGVCANFVNTFKQNVKNNYVDVIVCSHSDSDHIFGVRKLMETGIKPCSELWVPAEWYLINKNLNPKLKRSYEDLISSLKERLDQYTEYEEGFSLFDAHGLSFIDRILKYDTSFFKKMKMYNITNVIHMLIQFEVISDIVNLAMNLGVICRWFNYVDSNPSGGEPFLEPINCEEFLSTQITKIKPKDLNNLNRKNKEALVFKSCLSNRALVIFSSDSNFNFSQPLPVGFSKESILYTAPHHGSVNNANAYSRLDKITDKNSYCIRSHGSSKVGSSHINAQAQKYCTQCNTMKGTTAKIVEAKLGVDMTWNLLSQTPICQCK